MWLRYLIGQWHRYFEIERDVWHSPATPDRSWFQGSLSWLSITTWHLNYPVEFQFLNIAHTERNLVREVVIVRWKPKVSRIWVDPCSSPAVLFLIQFSPYQEETYLFKTNVTGRWKKRDFFPLWILSALHRAWCIVCVQKLSERMNEIIIISLESMNWLILMTGSYYLLWFCGCFAGGFLCVCFISLTGSMKNLFFFLILECKAICWWWQVVQRDVLRNQWEKSRFWT